MKRNIAFAAVVLGSLTAFALAMHFALPDTTRASDLVGIVQASATALAIAAGGLFAGYKLQLFRDFQPHLTISHEVSHRLVGDSYVHIAVTANLRNSSKVKLEFRQALFRLQQVAPITDAETERLYAQVFVNAEQRHLQWPMLDEATLQWTPGALIIEPGELHPETYEFIVSSEVKSVIIYTHFYNPSVTASGLDTGWLRTTVYDIVARK